MKQNPVIRLNNNFSSQASKKLFSLDCGMYRVKTMYSFICSSLPLIAVFAWDAVSCWVQWGREKVETRGQGLAGVFSGHWTHR